jgi:hypothetical protein
MKHFMHLALLVSFACTYRTYWHDEGLPPTNNELELWPNEPDGLEALSDWPEDQLEGGGWSNVDPDSITSGQVSIVSDPSAPVSPDNVMQFWFPVGLAGGAVPGTLGYFALPEPRELYVGLWWKVSDPWEEYPVFALWQLQPGFGMVLKGPDRKLGVLVGFSGDDRSVGSNIEDTGVSLDQWHRVEIYARFSTTSSTADGVLRWWLDGELLGDYDDITFSDGIGFEQFFIYPGSAAGDPARSQDGYFWLDHIRLSVP